ncbi:MAG: hypothetical protein FJ294_07860 [Planctomycetes bacterium]|nr:hypothetical protein [Planctomycetota bacterium]
MSGAGALGNARGECRALFAFDVAQSIDLAGAARAIREPSSEGKLGHTHPAPAYFQFKPPPLRIVQSCEPLAIGRWTTEATCEVVIFEFGAVLVSFAIAMDRELADCVELSCALAVDTSLEDAARARALALAQAIPAHVTKPGLADVFEDYSVFRLPAHMLGDDAERFLADCGPLLAGILRAERAPLSREVQADALSVRLQYGPDDLTLVDWHAAVVLDDQPEDVLRLLEYANVQLLEMRFLDAQLDAALEDSYRSLSRRETRHLYGPLALRRDLRRLSSMQLEAAFLFERVGNTLKVSGDQFLARVLRQAGTRFRLQEWNDAAQRKLAALDNVYDKLHDDASTLRAEVLEILIVLLIVFEIVLSLAVD